MDGSSHIVRVAAILATAALALLSAACGGSRPFPASDSSRNTGGSTTSAAATHGAVNAGSVEQHMKTDDCPTICAKSDECSNLMPYLPDTPFQVSP
jgi:hypothetical protein